MNEASLSVFLLILLGFGVRPGRTCFGGAQDQIAALRKQLGGDIEIDFSTLNPLIKYPSMFGQFKISFPCDLNCRSFDGLGTPTCRWRNEWTSCGGLGDELDWIRAKNSWGRDQGLTIFGTEETATHCYILVGSQRKLPPEHAALLVSDPIQCQEGDGQLQFRFWTSPKTQLRVCMRKPGMGKFYDWCSCPITKGDPGPALVVVPGSVMYTFELVIEASHFDFDAFGMQGGAVIIDDISYEAASIYNCRYIPHVEPPVPLAADTCRALVCSFGDARGLDGGQCVERIKGSGWRLSSEPTGNLHTGIRMLQEGSFAYSKGVGTRIFRLGSFEMARQGLLEFCYYIATQNVTLKVYSEIKGFQRSLMYESEALSLKPHFWNCRQVVLHQGLFLSLEFVAEDVKNGYAYVGLDSLRLVDPQTNADMCEVQLQPLQTPSSSLVVPSSLQSSNPFSSNSSSESSGVEGFSSFIDPDSSDLGLDPNVDPLASTDGVSFEEGQFGQKTRSKQAGSKLIKIQKLTVGRRPPDPPKDPFD